MYIKVSSVLGVYKGIQCVSKAQSLALIHPIQLCWIVISDVTKTTNYYVVCFVCKQYNLVVTTV